MRRETGSGRSRRRMKSIGYGDLLVGVGVMMVLEGLLFTALPNWMRSAMKSALTSPDNILRRWDLCRR
jgi:uncharacterized protein YjeT (DUF2065 family)